MSKDLNTKDGQKSFIEDYLDELLAGINQSYGPILLKELQKRLEFTINEFNEEINQAFGLLKKRDENRRAKYDNLELDNNITDENQGDQSEWEKKLDQIEIKK